MTDILDFFDKTFKTNFFWMDEGGSGNYIMNVTKPTRLEIPEKYIDMKLIEENFKDLEEYGRVYNICGTHIEDVESEEDKIYKECGEIENNVKTSSNVDLNSKIDISSFAFTKFGSLLDWIPIIGDNPDSGFNCILLNSNPDSIHFGKCGMMASDSHSRQGYFISNLSLDEIKDQLSKAGEYEDDAIQHIMVKNGMEIYYG